MVLWDRYLVYAAAFGISDRVMAEFAKAYPQVTDPQWLDAHGAGSLLYWSYRPYGYGYMAVRPPGRVPAASAVVSTRRRSARTSVTSARG